MKRLHHRNDTGASLLIVLIIVTVVSAVMGVVLSQVDTSVRTTVVLRDQTSDNYASDAAAQAVVTQVQNGTLACATPAPSNTTLGTGTANPFYTPNQTQDGPLNASATCTPDTVNGTTTTTTTTGSGVTIDDNNTIGYSVLTVGTNSGQTYGTVCLSGGSVVSNSTIDANSLKVGIAASQTSCVMQANSNITVTSAAANGCNGSPNDSSPGDYTPTPCTHAPAPIPVATWKSLAPAPLAGYNTTTGVNPAPLCYSAGGTDYAAFRPGKYTTVPGSGSSCSNPDFEWFTPGTYYFDYSTMWSWPNYLVAGTPQDSAGNVISSLSGFDVTLTTPANKAKLAALAGVTKFPGACADPALQSTSNGVEFVFGGSSTFQPSQHTSNSIGTNEVCASYSAGQIPVAIYGVSSDITGGGALALTGGGSISAETLCAAPPCTYTSADGNNQSLIVYDSNGHNTFFAHGYIYAPSAPISFRIKNSAGVLLGWGIVLRSLNIGTNGASPAAPYIVFRPGLHQGFVTITTTTYSIRYINVWTCLASSTACPQNGTPDVRVKVQTTGATVKVLSWSHQR